MSCIMKKNYSSTRIYIWLVVVFSIILCSCNPGDSESQRKKRGIKEKEYYTNPKEYKKKQRKKMSCVLPTESSYNMNLS